MRELLADLLQQATRRGATAADAFVVADESFSAQVRLGQVETVKHAREQHCRCASSWASRWRPPPPPISRPSRWRGWWTRRCRSRASRARTRWAACPTPRSWRARCRIWIWAIRAATISVPRRRSSWPAARGGRARGRSPHHQLRGRGLQRSARALRLRDQPRLRGRVRDVLVQPRGLPGGERERRDAARLLVPRHPRSARCSRRRRRSAATRRGARCAASAPGR